MAELPVEVSLEAAGAVASTGRSMLTRFTSAQRAKRAAVLFGIALLLAMSLLPIPIIHFIGPPMILIAGGATALSQLRATARLAPLRIACPRCGGENRVGGGVGVRDAEAPVERLCEQCRRVLTLRIRPLEPSAGSPPSL